jgi:hypothetical protein
LPKGIYELTQETLTAAECYKQAAEKFRILMNQIYAVSGSHPDSIEAMRIATRDLDDALERYRMASAKFFEILPEAPPVDSENRGHI